MNRIAVFPGSFDPFTTGHESIVVRAKNLFDKIIIAIGYNVEKKDFFPLDKRIAWIKRVFPNDPKIEVDKFEGLTMDFCKKVNAKYLLRGLRTAIDFEYERAIGQMNREINPDVETVYLLTTPELTAVNSTIVRDIIRHGGDASKFVPENIDLYEK